jgi:hypothetical protein
MVETEIKTELHKPQTVVSSDQESRNNDKSIKIGFLLINAGFAIFISSLFIIYGKETVEAYRSSPELTFMTIMISIRLTVMFIFSGYMFRKWFAQEQRYFKNIPFLVGLFFYFVAIGKCLDIILYIYFSSPNFIEAQALFLTKIRYYFLIITFLPMLFLGLRPVIYNWGIKRGFNDKKVLSIRRTIIAIYVSVFAFLITIAPSIPYITIILMFMSVLTYISIWYIFRFAHKHNTFPTIRANMVSWGFLMYLIVSPSRMILSTFFLSLTHAYLIGEILDFISISIIFLGFVLKPK